MKKIICIFLVIMTLLILFVGCKSDSNNNNEESSQIDTTPQVHKCEHLWEQWAVITEATCEKPGKKQRGCHNCEESQTEEIAKLEHKESDWIIDDISTTTQEGKKHTECVYCKKQIKFETIPFVEENHIHKAVESIVNKKPDCVNNGVKYYICSCGYTVKTESVKALGHTVVTDAAVASDCTSSGLTEGSHCSICNVILVKQQVIAAKGHVMKQETKSDSTSGENYILNYCANCSYSYKEELPTADKIIYDANGIAYIEDENGDLWASGIGNCTSSDIVISSKVEGKTVIGVESFSFNGNYDIKSVTFDEGITIIKSSAFSHCGNLKLVNFPSTLKRIEDHSFYNSKFETITLPEGLEYIGARVCIVESGKLIIPDSVKEIGDYAFADNGIEEVVIPGNVTLGTNVFKNCTSLRKVLIKDGLKNIPKQTFANCKQLEEINLPASITSYGYRAFSGCYKLRVSHLGIKNANSSGAFSGIRIDMLEIYCDITSDMFSGCSIGTLILHEGVTKIGKDAFSRSSISKIQLPSTLTTVESYAFYQSGLNDVVFKSSVLLGYSSFKGSTIKTLTLPKGSQVESYVFVDCESLQTVTFGGTMNEWNRMISIPNYGYNVSDFKDIHAATIICSDGTIAPNN